MKRINQFSVYEFRGGLVDFFHAYIIFLSRPIFLQWRHLVLCCCLCRHKKQKWWIKQLSNGKST